MAAAAEVKSMSAESPAMEMASTFLSKMFTKGIHKLGRNDMSKEFFKKTPAMVQEMLEWSPEAISGLLGLLSENGHPVLAEFLEKVLTSATQEVSLLIGDAKESGTPGAILKAIETVTGEDYAVTLASMSFHRLDCILLSKAAQQLQPRKGKDGKVQDAPAPTSPYELRKLQACYRQGLHPCQTCFGFAQKPVEAQVPAAEPETKKKNAFEIVQGCKDAATNGAFRAFMSPLKAHERKRVWELFKQFLDSEAEFVFVMAQYAALTKEERPFFLGQLEQLLRLDEANRSEAKSFMELIGNQILGGEHVAMDLVREIWNAHLDTAPSKTAETKPEEPQTDIVRSVLPFIFIFEHGVGHGLWRMMLLVLSPLRPIFAPIRWVGRKIRKAGA
ncbi:MAG: hypothetical protein RLZZ324_291 [Candidatus Parcubacteria bacterium]